MRELAWQWKSTKRRWDNIFRYALNGAHHIPRTACRRSSTGRTEPIDGTHWLAVFGGLQLINPARIDITWHTDAVGSRPPRHCEERK